MVQSCAACGCEVDDAESVRHGTHHYCSECARLILAPNDLQASSPRVRAISKSALAAASPNPTPANGYNVVEEFNLTPDEVPVAEEEDDPVFGSGGKPGGSSADDTIDMLPGQKAPRPSSRLQQAPSNAVGKAISGIGKAVPAMKTKPKPGATAGKPARKGMAKSTGAGRSAHGSERRPMRPGFPGKKLAQAPQDAEVLDAQPADADESEDFVVPMKKSKVSGRKGKSERTGGARGSQRSKSAAARTSGRRSSRDRGGDDERESGRKKVVAKRAEGLSTNAMIGIGVGVAFLLGMALFLSEGGDSDPAKKKPAQQVVEEDNDTTPSSEYARRAQDREAKGEKKAAFENYIKAANRAQSEGATTQAQRYAMQAKTIKETYHLNDR